MASLTVRQLDERLKKLLRLRAARSGRSVEDEVRTILRAAAEKTATKRLKPSPRPANRRLQPRDARRARLQDETRAADHRRRHRRLQVPRTDPPPGRTRRRRCAHPDQGGRRISSRRCRPALAGENVFTDLFSSAANEVGHIGWRAMRSGRGGAGHRRPDGQDGERSRQRSRLHRAARHRQEGADGAGDECADVATRRRSAISRNPERRRRAVRRPERRRDGLRRIRAGPHGRAAGDRRGHRKALPQAVRGRFTA